MAYRGGDTYGDSERPREFWFDRLQENCAILWRLCRFFAWLLVVIIFVPVAFAILAALVLFLWGRKMSPWLSYCNGGLYRMYFFVYYPVRILFIGVLAHVIFQYVFGLELVDSIAVIPRFACVGIVLISLLYLIPAGITGCSEFESEFMRQKEAWPEDRQAELQQFLDSVFPGEPISAFVDTLCRNYNWKWMLMIMLASVQYAFIVFLTRDPCPWFYL